MGECVLEERPLVIVDDSGSSGFGTKGATVQVFMIGVDWRHWQWLLFCHTRNHGRWRSWTRKPIGSTFEGGCLVMISRAGAPGTK